MSATPNAQASTDQTSLAVDFAQGADYPLLKSKFAIFNSGIVPLSTYERDAELFAIAKPESLRIDLGWGADWTGWTEQPIQGTPEAPVYHLTEFDGIAKILNDRNVLPYWSYCYTPTPLQDPSGEWRSAPSDVDAWGRMLGDLARHYRSHGDANSVGYHEVYNEPDNDYFWIGTMEDYFAIYATGVQGIRAADPDALVGGPALAFTFGWIKPFVDFVAERQLPFDFFSTHVYGTEDAYDRLDAMLDASRDALDRHPEFATVEIHLNEFNSYPIDYPIDGTQQKHRLAVAFLRDMGHLLARPEVTIVHWAQFLDSGQDNYSGMISIDGHRKALFNAAEIYTRLPVDRSPVTIDGAPDVGAFAGRDDHRAAIAIWNFGRAAQTVAIDLANIPFATGSMTVHRVDAEHGSWGDGTQTEDLTPVETVPEIATADLSWSGTVPAGGIVYIEVNDVDSRSDASETPVARWRRTLRYYPSRTTTAYADFDKNDWTFRLGMAAEDTADLIVGVLAAELPDALVAVIALEGSLPAGSAGALLGLRVDYLIGDEATLGVSIPIAGQDQPDLPMPWGTGRAADRVVAAGNGGSIDVPLRAMAPEGWDRRAQITAILHDGGVGTRAKIRLRRP